MLPDSEKSGVDVVVAALRKQFKPGGTEELRGLEFHHRTQGDETIKQLGLSIQQLGRKAFPSIAGKDLTDCSRSVLPSSTCQMAVQAGTTQSRRELL